MDLVYSCFAPQFAVSEENKEKVQEAATNFEDYVLKPQREVCRGHVKLPRLPEGFDVVYVLERVATSRPVPGTSAFTRS